MTAPTVIYEWSGEAMVPVPGFGKVCDEHFVVGARYRLEVREDRSPRSHAHYFAALHSAYMNLPEHRMAQFANFDHFRKWLLIQAGHRDERTIVCDSPEAAQKVQAFLKPIDPYAIVIVNDKIVVHLTAKSQSYSAMDKATFQASKDATLEIAAAMIDVDRATLEANAKDAA